MKENEARKNNKINRYINIYIYILYSVETFKFSLLPRYDIYLPIAYIYIYGKYIGNVGDLLPSVGLYIRELVSQF